MKKLLLILLIIVGCNNSTESEPHPLLGNWEFLKAIDCYTNETKNDLQGHLASAENYVLKFYNDNSLIINTTNPYSTTTDIFELEWNSNDTTFNMIWDDLIADDENYHYVINGDTLKYNQPSSNYCYILIKQ